MRGGKREGAGRKKGEPNKASQARQAAVAKSGSTPLEVMIKRMRYHEKLADREMKKGRAGDADKIEHHLDLACEAADKAAPFVHPRLATMAHTGKNGGPIQTMDLTNMTDEQLAALEPVLSAIAGAGAAVAAGEGGDQETRGGS